jgi:hypothetical protein
MSDPLEILIRRFQVYCAMGELFPAQRLFQTDQIQTHLQIERIHPLFTAGPWLAESFMVACTNGHLKVAQWLYSVDRNDNLPFGRNDTMFADVCANGHLAVAQWLYSVQICSNYDFAKAFKLAFTNTHLDAQWWRLVHPTLTTDTVPIFKQTNTSAVAIWLLRVNPELVAHINLEELIMKCGHHELGLVRRLCSLLPPIHGWPTVRSIGQQSLSSNNTSLIYYMAYCYLQKY